MALPQTADVIDPSAQSRWATNRQPLNSLTYKSSFVPPVTHYVIGKVDKEGDLHLVPLEGGMFMMRCGFGHVDKEEEGGGGNVGGKENSGDPDGDGESEVRFFCLRNEVGLFTPPPAVL